MPITPYVRPQETITQILRTTPAPLVNRRNPLVIGPEYLLGNYDADNRYEVAYDGETLGLVDSMEYSYLDAEGLVQTLDSNTHELATDSVKIFCEGLEVVVSSGNVIAARGETSTALVVPEALAGDEYFKSPVADELLSNMNGRSIKVGDIVYATVGGTTYRRTVTSLTTQADGRAIGITVNGIVPGDAGDSVSLKIVALVTAELDADYLTAASLSAIQVQSSGVSYQQFSFKKEIMGTTADCDSQVSKYSGKLSVYFRATRKVDDLEAVLTIRSLGDLDQLGTIHIDNWLAYGAYMAFQGSQSARVYALRTNGDTVADFQAALNKIRSTDYYYALAPMTDRDDVKELVAAHCDEMSNKYNRNFRRCYVGTDTPEDLMIWKTKQTGDLRIGVVDKVNNRIVIDDNDQSVSNFVTDLSIGDTITIGVTQDDDGKIEADSGEKLTIKRIISQYEVEFNETTTLSGAQQLTATRKNSSDNVVKYFQERNIGSRRCVNVWSDNPVQFARGGAMGLSSESARVPMKFVAAEIAGLRCALLPQQGLTMTELRSIDAAPNMYTRFTPEQLDIIASNGVMIAAQEIEGGAIFIRHQLTTKTDAGALAYEDNVGVIVDEFSYRVKDAFRQYLGRRNVSEESISEIRSRLKGLAIDATQESIANRELGPMVIRFFNEDDEEGEVTVRVDGNLADHIVTYVRLRVPLPINGIDHYIDVETSVEL